MNARLNLNRIVRMIAAALLASGIIGNIQEVSANSFLLILSLLPLANDLDVPPGSDIKVQFDDTLDTSTVSSASFIVQGNQKGVYTGTFTYPNPDLLRFVPDEFFKPGEKISVTATSDIQSSLPEFLQPRTWQFTAAARKALAGLVSHPVTPSFGAGESYDIALGDLDGDGDLDAVVANYNDEAETVWLNEGSGNFSAHPTTPSFGAGASFRLALGDLDSDGDLDAVVANFSNQAETVWLNNGSGSFTAHPTTPSFGAQYSWGIALGDLDSDGDLDAVVANFSGQAETVWLNNGSGSFTAHPSTPSFGADNSYDVDLGDLDNDGDLDVVVSDDSNQPGKVWLNDGIGGFTAHPVTASFGLGNNYGVSLGDLDGDGDLDALQARHSGSPEAVWVNDGSGSFTAHPTAATFGAGNSYNAALGDLDGDGDLDAVVANITGEAESVWLNNGSGAFTAHPAIPTFGAHYSTAIALGDLDGDRDMDAVVANAGTEAETAWLNNLTYLYLPLLTKP
jgi:hypothetical protein